MNHWQWYGQIIHSAANPTSFNRRSTRWRSISQTGNHSWANVSSCSSCLAGVVCLGLGWDPPMLSTSSPSQSSSLGATALIYFMKDRHSRFRLAEQTWREMKSSSTPLPPRKFLPVQSLAKPGGWIEFLVWTIKRYVQKIWKFYHIHSFRANETQRYSANLITFLKLVSEFLRVPGNWASLL